MPHEITVDRTRRVVVARVHGAADRAELVQLVNDARGLAAASGFNILYDVRGATAAFSSGELFWLPRQVDVLRAPDASKVRVAGLHHHSQAEIVHTWETMFRNAGLQARAFTDEAEAVRWLAE